MFLFCQLTFVFYREEIIFISSQYLAQLFKCLKKQYSKKFKKDEIQALWINTKATIAKHPENQKPKICTITFLSL